MSELAGYQTIPSSDFSRREDRDAVIQEEHVDFISPETRGQISS